MTLPAALRGLPRPDPVAAAGLAAGVALLALACVFAIGLPAGQAVTGADAIAARAPAGAEAPEAVAEARAREAAWRRQLGQWHLFGEATAPIDSDPDADAAAKLAAGRADDALDLETLDADALPDSAAGLRLTGVVAASDGARALAVIAAAGSEERYAVGDELPGGALLEAVKDRSVVIRRNGRLEALRLPRENLELESAAIVDAPGPARAAPAEAPERNSAAGRLAVRESDED